MLAEEAMYFHGAPLAHVVLYYERMRAKRLGYIYPSRRPGRHVHQG